MKTFLTNSKYSKNLLPISLLLIIFYYFSLDLIDVSKINYPQKNDDYYSEYQKDNIIKNDLNVIKNYTTKHDENKSNSTNNFISKPTSLKEKNTNNNEYTTYFAIQDHGVIGKKDANNIEFPDDNFFSVSLPENIDVNLYDFVLGYDLLGLAEASQTTKSINNSVAYGGKVILKDDQWKHVEEKMMPNILKPGKNEIVFSRYTDSNYQYEIKNLQIILVKKEHDKIKLSQPVIANNNGNIYLLGFATKDVKAIMYGNEPIPITDGIFESVIHNISSDSSNLALEYITSSNETHTLNIPVTFESKNFEQLNFDEPIQSKKYFSIQNENNDNISNENCQLILTNTEKTIKGKIVLTGLFFKDMKPLDLSIDNVTSGKYEGYRVETNNIEVQQTKIKLGFDKNKIPEGYTEKDINTFYFDPNKKAWIMTEIDSLNIENQFIIAQYNGDTDYINGILKAPESPEAANYTPTTISDIEFANPSTGVVSIAPPSPNYNGNASTSFPLKLPNGRGGIQPSLSVDYNSEGGNGWMGIGWNMQLPAITLDTRWGVPRFETGTESEIYSLNGSMLVLHDGTEYTDPHRKENISRGVSDRQFYPRVEGSYAEIIRKGNSTTNYYWVVTDKMGNKSYYGGISAFSPEHVIKDAEGHITHWALYRTEDTFGNYVEYHYTQDSINVNGVTTRYFYPDYITYTRHANSMSNYYKAEFKRNNYSSLVGGGSFSNRSDVQLDARTGVMMLTQDLLTEINVQFIQGTVISPIRSYKFEYTEGPFKKQQLTKISEYDANGGLFYSNTMEYFDEIGTNNIINNAVRPFNGGSIVTPNPFSDFTSSNIIPKGSALGASGTSGYTLGIRAGIGIGINKTKITSTIGGSYNYNKNTEKTHISFIDINGDGLPDLVYKNSDGIKYKLNNTNGFSQSTDIDGISKLSETKSYTNGWGVDGNIGFNENLSVGFARSKSKTKSITSNYFSDFNGDGLPDVVSGGLVKFNITTNNGYIVNYENQSTASSNPILSGSLNSEMISEMESLEDLSAMHQKFDHIKIWKVPFNGSININSIARLVYKNSCNEDNTINNNFRLSIEKAKRIVLPYNSTPIWNSQPIISGQIFSTIGQTEELNGTNINVEKDQYIIFRIHNLEYGCGGEFEWEPNILYTSIDNIPNLSDPYLNKDENGNNLFYYSSLDDFLINNGGSWSPKNGNSLKFKFNLPTNLNTLNLSDKIEFVFEESIYNTNDPESTPLITSHVITYIPENNTFSPPISEIPNISVDSQNNTLNYAFNCYVRSDSNVDWKSLNWQPSMHNNNDNSLVDYLPINYIIYDNNLNQKKYWLKSTDFVQPIIDPAIENDGSSSFMKLSHDLYENNALTASYLFQFKDESFPIKINWVTKVQTQSGITSVLSKKIFYLQKTGEWTDLYCPYVITSDINGNNPVSTYDNKQIFSKIFVQNIVNNQSKLFSAFYVENNTEFGRGINKNLKLTLFDPNNSSLYPTFSDKDIYSPFLSQKMNFVGFSNRGWGDFMYNGDINYIYNEEGEEVIETKDYNNLPTDLSFFENENISEDEIDMENIPEENSIIRFLFYKQNNQNNEYDGNGIVYQKDNEENPIFTTYKKSLENGNNIFRYKIGRFGENNLYDLFVDIDAITPTSGIMVALKQKSLSKGKATTLNFGVDDIDIDADNPIDLGTDGTLSNAESNDLIRYMDLNGDKYPDLITINKIQYSKMTGGLGDVVIENSNVSGSKSYDATGGMHIAGLYPNSTQLNKNKTKIPLSSGLNSSAGKMNDSRQWIDINGDGLPDFVKFTENEVKVKLNLGNKISDDYINWGSNYEKLISLKRTSSSVSLGIGNDIEFESPDVFASYAAGVGLGDSTSYTNATLLDVNGDGLPDLVFNDNGIYKYFLNNGKGFNQDVNIFYNNSSEKVELDYSFSGNIYGTFTFGFIYKVLGIPIKFVFTPSASGNIGLNEKRKTLADINGDGLVDVLSYNPYFNANLLAHTNQVGKTHLLKKVNNPLGGNWEINYARTGNTFDMPQSKWVLSDIITYDGFTGDETFKNNKTRTIAEYYNPKYNRREREFLGFGNVEIKQVNPDNISEFHSKSYIFYHNENVYLKGLVKKSIAYIGDEIVSEETTLYNILNPINPQVNYLATNNNHYLQTGLDPDLLDISRLFVAPVRTISKHFENNAFLSTEARFDKYDSYGNLLTYINMGDGANGEGAYKTQMHYLNSINNINNSKGFIDKISVYSYPSNELLRQRSANYNPSDKGKISEFITKLNDTESATDSFTYDSTYGNLIKIKQPNDYWVSLTYDNILKTYPTRTTNTHNHASYATYNYVFGVPLTTTDINGKIIRYRYDDRGRMIEVVAPNEINSNSWTIRMQYEGEGELAVPASFNNNNYILDASGSFNAQTPGAAPTTTAKHYAVTRHNVSGASGNQLLTISLVDGNGEALQLKKTHYSGTTPTNGSTKWLISGKEKKDVWGCVIETYLTTVQTGYPINNPNSLASTAFDYQNTIPLSTIAPPTIMTYDNKDRIATVQQPGESSSSIYAYSIENDLFTTQITNELGQKMKTYTDILGRQHKTVQNEELTTQFYFNTVGEVIKVRNNAGYENTYSYDLAGRRIEERSQDRGVTTYKYNTSSNLIERKTSNLMTNGQQQAINYTYDYNHLTGIHYPQNPENDITYTYGNSSNSASQRNAIGRLYMQQDASGVQGFGYDNLGNMNLQLRGVAVAGSHTYWFKTEWYYDSFGRINSIKYPDNEVISYNYNLGGELNSVTRNSGVNIINNIVYNDFGERTKMFFGNGAIKNYSYDTKRRLNNVGHQFTGFSINNQYQYDALNNVTKIASNNPSPNGIPNIGEIGGPIEHNYTYDTYNRLTHADGKYTGPNDFTTPLLRQEYTLDMTYDLSHNILTKKQTHVQGSVGTWNGPIQNPETVRKTNYHLEYEDYATANYITPSIVTGDYGYVQPHAPRTLIETPEAGMTSEDPQYKKTLIDYDANGNQTRVREEINTATQTDAINGNIAPSVITLKRNLWDEEDRLRAVDLNPEEPAAHQLAVYTYDAGGQRIVRYVPGRLDARSNENNVSQNERREVMLYPNSLITAKALTRPGVSPQGATPIVTNFTKHYYIGSERVSSMLGENSSVGLIDMTMVESILNNSFPRITDIYNTIAQNNCNVAFTHTYHDLDQAIGSLAVVDNVIVKGLQTKNYKNYWYHSDHLGSSSYISNQLGKVIQHMEYLPFGETLVDEHLNSYNSPFKFNAKELDPETGNYYYGARYYDPKSSLWLNVDPLAEKYPNFSPYAYTFQNPLNFVDPTGMAPDDWYQDLKTGNIKWFNGSVKRDGYFNLGSSTNTYSGNQGLQLNSNGTATDLNSGQLYGANKKISIGSFNVSTISVSTKSEGHFFGEVNVHGSVGVQVGLKATDNLSVSAGALSTDIGTIGYSTEKGFISEYGDGSNHNYVEGKFSISDKLQIYGKADYVYDHMPQANMMNESDFIYQGGLGTKIFNSPLSSENKKFGGSTTGFIKVGKDEISVDFSAGLKVVLGVDAHIKFGYKF